jgi:hypothetical protein
MSVDNHPLVPGGQNHLEEEVPFVVSFEAHMKYLPL